MEDMSLSVVCKYLERWYDVEITLQPGLGEKIRYNGVIQEETVTDVMDALSRLSNISYHVKGKHISITSKYGFRGCRIFVDSVSFVFYGNFSERIGGSGQYECRLWESFGDHVAGWIFGQVECRF